MGNLKDFFEYVFNVFKFWVIIQPWEQGVMVRMGKNMRILRGGMYFKIPYLDSVFVQEVRLRNLSLSMQSLTTKDGKNVTIKGSMGYSIFSIKTLYDTLFHPESTLANIAMSIVSDYVLRSNLSEINPAEIIQEVIKSMDCDKFGIKLEYYRITTFAVVRTYRLIQDGESWNEDKLKMNLKK